MTELTADELWDLAYFVGDVRLNVGGGHDSFRYVSIRGAIYRMPADADELRAVLANSRVPKL